MTINGYLFQQQLIDRGAKINKDGDVGKLTVAAFFDLITNKNAPAIDDATLSRMAGERGVSLAQIKAVSFVETNGGGWLPSGRLKNLFERHKFHEITNGIYPQSDFNNPIGGGYNVDTWGKLSAALRIDPIAAIASASWGKFQIMGYHAHGKLAKNSLDLGYSSIFEMLWQMSRTEEAHYDAFFRFIDAEKIAGLLRAVGTDPVKNRPFVVRYNGVAGVRLNKYDVKLAQAMRKFT